MSRIDLAPDEFRACPDCGSRGRVYFGDRCLGTRLVCFESFRCDACGRATEADDAGPLPESRRNAVIRRGGLWAVEVAAGEAAADVAYALRRVLDLTPAEALAMARHPDRHVLRGTCSEARRIATSFERDGIACRVVCVVPGSRGLCRSEGDAS